VRFRDAVAGENRSVWKGRRDGDYEFELGVVAMDADRAVGVDYFGRQSAAPDKNVVCEDEELGASDFGAQSVRRAFARVDRRERQGELGLDLGGTALAAFVVEVLRRIAFDHDGDVGLRFETPHDVNQVAGVLREQFETKLMVDGTGGSGIVLVARAEIDEMGFDILRSLAVHGGVDIGIGDQETMGGQGGDGAFGDAEVGQQGAQALAVAGFRGCRSPECDSYDESERTKQSRRTQRDPPS